ncbi:vacuolar fusion CCZ1 -like protein [Brachionus plicatilis]|uniref:Vacuolar fusion CCZ1-like protein n=1 Tax=Brachionus plicatilis TaxID=10195 RepID=A0A3M7PS60_BRAPC|nr:vacuolar fusion CCZ1 -like protein [Brachionus plicatilis]
MRHELVSNQISLANFFIFNPDYGQKEGKEAEKIFYYYPPDEKIEKQIRTAGFCAGMIKFTQTFKSSKPCEFVHTEKVRMIINELGDNFWMVIGINVPLSLDKVYENDLLSDQIYMSVLKKIYNYYQLFNGKIGDSLKLMGQDKLKEKMKLFFDDYIETKLNVRDYDIMNTFNGLQFMSLDRNMYLKIQSLLNLLEEKLPLVQRVVVMHSDQVIWSGLEQEDISAIYQYLKELISKNATSVPQSQLASKFLVDENAKNLMSSLTNPSTSNNSENSIDQFDQEYFEFKRVYLDKPDPEQFYLIPYNLSKMTFFVFIPTSQSFKLSLLKEIDEILAPNLVLFIKEISEQQLKRSSIFTEEKEIKYIYFNRLNLAQKSTLNKTKDLPKHLMALIAQLSKDLESCVPSGEIFVKSGKDYWIACKKSDLREVYVVVCQKNANLTMIDEEVKQLCSTDFSNIFFME